MQSEKNNSRRRDNMRVRLLSLFVRHRWGVVAAISLLMLILEWIKVITDVEYGVSTVQIFEGALYVIGVPAGAWLLLTLLAGAETERAQANFTQNLQTEFSQKLGDTHGWEDLVKEIVMYTHQALPSAKITLSVIHPQTMCMQVEAECSPDGEVILKPKDSVNGIACQAAILSDLYLQLKPTDKRILSSSAAAGKNAVEQEPVSGSPEASQAHRYKLPIIRSDQQVGGLVVEFPLNSQPAIANLRVVESMLPVIALALDSAILQNMAADQAAASDAERQRIVQDLHDSLAQNISYLRLKLDQLTGENAIHEISVVLQELERMRSTADEAYQQVRNTIDELAVINGQDLNTTIENQARTISSRAGFAIRTSIIGTARMLPAITRQHIVNIAREALHNIEKHAQASQVSLQFIWLETELILKITDNGIGFHPSVESTEGHYGMWIMQQRAQSMGGMIKITPADERGTEITLWVPYQKSAD